MKRILLVIGLFIAAGAIYGWLEYNRTATDLATKQADFVLSAAQLTSAFEVDEPNANEKYLGKVIEVEGEILSRESGEHLILTLKGTEMVSLRAEMTSSLDTDFEVGKSLKLRGICTGFLLDVVLNECVIVD